jgi:hypothetical protein
MHISESKTQPVGLSSLDEMQPSTKDINEFNKFRGKLSFPVTNPFSENMNRNKEEVLN